jgi:GTP-binding protein
VNTETDAEKEAWTKRGRMLFAKDCRFVRGIVRLADLPAPTLPEVAFIGRSNVGKSSLINALTGRTALTRVSNTPGRTREINLFDLNGQLMLADLPGYGYAKAPKHMARAWQRLIKEYLRGSTNLARVCLLADARHGLMANDQDMMTLLDVAAVSYLVVLTKADKIGVKAQDEALRQAGEVARRHGAAFPEILLTSSETFMGLDTLRGHIARLARLAG